MQIIRIAANTQLAYAVPITIYGARLVHSGATVANIYDEVVSSGPTDTCKRIRLAVTASVLSDDVKIPAQGIKFSVGCYIKYDGGEIFLTID